MKNKNMYGFYSGGFIFDTLDRVAMETLRERYNVKGFLFTLDSKICFFKQLCNLKNIKYIKYTEYDGYKTYKCSVQLWQEDLLISDSDFTFYLSDKNYCENIKE